MKPTVTHKVTCAVCGNTGSVEIDRKTRKILDENWWYWGKAYWEDRNCFDKPDRK